MSEKTEKTVLQVPAVKVDEIVMAIKKVSKRAAKLGLPLPVYTISEPTIIQKTNWLGFKVDVEIITITVDPGTIKLPGYKLLGKMEHEGKFNLLYPVPGAAIDHKFRTSDAHCDHCKKVRDRKMLYVFERESDGEQIQVGKSCLKDFMGVEPGVLAYYASLDYDLGGDSEEECWGRNSYYIDLASFTAVTAAVIEVEGGYISNATAKANEVESTSEKVADYLWPQWTKNEEINRKRKAYREKVQARMTQELVDKAAEAIRFMRDDWKNTSDYAWNLKVIATKGAVTSSKQYGIGASLWPAYMREMGRLVEIEAKRKAEKEAAKDSEFLGKVGDRLRNVEATVTMAVFVRSGDFGDTYLYKFLTADGNVMSWFSSPRGLNKGDKVKVTGTVKEQKVYKDVKETQLTRCKVEEKVGVV